jgi:hypothetical protein
MKNYLIDQPGSLGDILFTIKIAEELNAGGSCTWNINPVFWERGLKRLETNFRFGIRLGEKPDSEVIKLTDLTDRSDPDIMTKKYDVVGIEWENWSNYLSYERDKDIANAIRYAADNGAKVINMSFGKYYTPNKEIVDEAIRYAASKDVLLVHAAGNDAKDKDIEDSYPTRILSDASLAKNWLEIGASSSKSGSKLLADFSNYGAKSVDVFAPGVDIYSTVPDAKYEDASGTSMACPATAGVAALIRSYFPELSAEEVASVIMKTAEPYSKTIKIPGKSKKDSKGKMNQVCITGSFVNGDILFNSFFNLLILDTFSDNGISLNCFTISSIFILYLPSFLFIIIDLLLLFY